MVKEVIRVVSAVIERDNRYLITQRKPSAVLPLLWEFPGGRVEPGETDTQALKREVRERLGVDVMVLEKFGENTHEYEAYSVFITLYACTLPEGQVERAVGVNAARWVRSSELDQYEFPPADQDSMSELLRGDTIH